MDLVNPELRVPLRSPTYRNAQERTFPQVNTHTCARAYAHESGFAEIPVPSRTREEREQDLLLHLRALRHEWPLRGRVQKALKFLLRVCRLQCISIRWIGTGKPFEEPAPTSAPFELPTQRETQGTR